jgi:hypothetical protein
MSNATGLAVSDTSSHETRELWTEYEVEVIEQNIIDEALKEVNAAIDKIKALRDGNTYRGAISYIADSETRISRKDPSLYNEELGKLLEKFKEWKIYVGSEFHVILDIALRKQKEEYENKFFLRTEVIEELLSFIRDENLKWAKQKMEQNEIFDIQTNWWIEFNSKIRVPSTPTELKTHWAGEKWKIPELLLLIDLLNLMFLKIELISLKSLAASFANLGVPVGDVIRGGSKFSKRKTKK